MTFASPDLLWLLLAPAVLLAWDLLRRRRDGATSHPRILRAEAGPRALRLTGQPADHRPRARRPRIWLCAGLLLAIAALARPQWGRIEEPVFDQSREILLAVDLSRSMLTPDVKPSRLDRAKLLMESLLEKLSGERVGMVVFAGTAFLQSPLSADYEILREFMPALAPGFLPEGGTNYDALLEASLQAFGNGAGADRFLVILSDGEATDDAWRSRLDDLRKKGIRVIGLGVGTAAGAMIPDGSGQFVKDERGAVVLSRLESATLEELARATGGVYRDASAWVDLAALVRETVEAGRKGAFVEKNTIRRVERFQWPLALGLWCLLLSFCYEFPVRPRPREIRLAPNAPRPAPPPVGTAALLLLGCLLAAATPALQAAAKLAPTSASGAPAAPGTPTPAASAAPGEPSALGRVVGRLSAAENPGPRDWAELARETLTWGSRLQSENPRQPLPPGPIQDALGALALGAKADPKAADWPKLRQDLEALLQTPPEDKQDQKKDDQKQDQQEQQDQDKQDQKSEQKKSQDQSGSSQDKSEKQEQSEQKQDKSDQKQEQKPSDERAFGDMQRQPDAPPPPPPSQETQKVGGSPKAEPQPEQADPNLALPLQKLDQLRQQDQPAQLFKLMEGDRKSPKKPGKDW